MLINEKHLAELKSPIQTINARVELHSGSTLVQICTCQDYLSNFTIERVGEGKFFGYGISHKLIVNFMDPKKELSLTNIDFLEVTFGVDGDFIYPFPTFHILEVERDEATNDIRVVAYDLLYQAANYKVSDLTLPSSYNILHFASACCSLLNVPLKFDNITDISAFLTEFPNGANFDGTEKLRQALDAIAEATQTIYYINGDWELTFKRLNQTGDPVLTIDRNQYIDLKSGANCTLGAICHTTELGDAITAGSADNGVTQYIRDNPFLELREDAATLLDNAIAAVGGMAINPFDCNWIGNYLLEIGDKIALVREDDSEIITYIVDDSITFDGTLGQSSRWEFISDEAETADNPSSLGEALNKTFARVDKVNKRIDLVASETAGNTSAIAQIQLSLDGIDLTIQESVNEALEGYKPPEIEGLEELKTTVSTHTDKISGIEIDIDNITSTVGNQTTKITTIETETGDLKERVTETENNISTLEQTISSITSTVGNQTTKITEIETDVSGLKQTIETHTSQISSLEINVDNISATVESHTSSIETNTNTIESNTNTIENHTSQISALQIEAAGISASVRSIEENIETSHETINENYEKLTKEVNLKMSAEDVQLAISSKLDNGVDSVTTTTGFTFNSEGLNISKSDSEINTTISENGMTIDQNGTEVLVANNQGVIAKDLHAVTYLWIGDNSRFEDQGNRTACFWIAD